MRLKFREQYVEGLRGDAAQTATDYDSMSKKVEDLKKELADLSGEMALFIRPDPMNIRPLNTRPANSRPVIACSGTGPVFGNGAEVTCRVVDWICWLVAATARLPSPKTFLLFGIAWAVGSGGWVGFADVSESSNRTRSLVVLLRRRACTLG